MHMQVYAGTGRGGKGVTGGPMRWRWMQTPECPERGTPAIWHSSFAIRCRLWLSSLLAATAYRPALIRHVLHQTISNACFPRRGIGSREEVLAQLSTSGSRSEPSEEGCVGGVQRNRWLQVHSWRPHPSRHCQRRHHLPHSQQVSRLLPLGV